MDRTWVKAPRLSEEYKIGVKEFCDHAVNHSKNINFILCPCQKCLNVLEVNGPAELYEHLMFNGIDKTYTCWTYHGESRGKHNSSNINSSYQFIHRVETEGGSSSVVKDVPNVVNEELRDHPDMHEKLKDDAAIPLWAGCTKASKLSAVLTLYNLKVGHQISDTFFTEMLAAVSELLPDGNVLPRRTYEVKQMLKSIGLVHNRIHACPNDCILYRKEYADLDECPKCSLKRFKKGNSPAKVMWYFPIIPRLRRLYASVEDSKHLTWHHDGRIKDGMLRHPADSPQWKTFDDAHQDFGKEPRNLRLALSTDGMNPYNLQSTSHSTWPPAKDKNGNYSVEPPALYAHMSTVAPYWTEFVEMSLKEDFLEKSNKNRERAEAMDARYRKACLGYARIREIIIANKIKAGETNPVVSRLDAWEYARQNVNGVVDDPVSLQVLEDVVEISKQLSENELTNIGTDDLLARLIPLEYPGRVRALGWGVTKSSLQAATSVSELSKLKNDVSFLKNEIMELKRKASIPGVQSGGSSHMDNFGMDDDLDGDHYDNHDDILSEDLPEGKNACYLYLEPGRRYVGRGILWNDINDRMLHGVPLEQGYVRVQFEVAEPTEFNTQLPRPCDEVTLVGEAPGYFLAWPRKLVSMKLETPSKIKNNENGKNAKAQEMFKNKEKEKTVESIAAVSSKQLLGYPLDEDVSHDGVVEMVRVTVILDRVSDVEIEMGPFWNGNPWTDHLNKENVLEVLNEQRLSASSLAFYIRYLCEVYLSKNPNLAAKFSFVSPHIVSHLVDISEASTNLAKIMMGYVDKEHLLLVPYNVSEHWILLGINTKTESIYFMDPAPRTTIVKYKNLRQLVETALVSFRTNSGKTYTKTAFSTFKWMNILCPKQPANDGIFCGHYVGCFIEDVLRSGETTISVNFTRSIRLMCHGRDKMVRFGANWAGFFYNRYLKGKLLNM